MNDKKNVKPGSGPDQIVPAAVTYRWTGRGGFMTATKEVTVMAKWVATVTVYNGRVLEVTATAMANTILHTVTANNARFTSV